VIFASPLLAFQLPSQSEAILSEQWMVYSGLKAVNELAIL
jgi:hypothetical protein